MKKKAETVDIILPSRIGDCILNFPSILCLSQLTQKLPEKNLKIALFSTNKLTEIIKALNLFDVKQFSNLQKLKTVFKPSEKAIFLEPSTNHLFFYAKKTYGANIKGKRINYQNNMPYLSIANTQSSLPEDLFKYLKEEYNFPTLSISSFGLLLELGFSVEEIIKNFEFNDNSLDFKKEITNWKPKINNYVVICMEAAYGSKKDADRRFQKESYFEISKYIYEKFKLESVYTGIDTKVKLPDLTYIHDYRKKINFEQLAQLMKYSKAYIGNDTGPLHLANLMKKQTLGIYSREDVMKYHYYPIFNKLNLQVLGFPSMQIIDDFCSKIV